MSQIDDSDGDKNSSIKFREAWTNPHAHATALALSNEVIEGVLPASNPPSPFIEEIICPHCNKKAWPVNGANGEKKEDDLIPLIGFLPFSTFSEVPEDDQPSPTIVNHQRYGIQQEIITLTHMSEWLKKIIKKRGIEGAVKELKRQLKEIDDYYPRIPEQGLFDGNEKYK